jgi:hypothetical protein
MGNVLKRNTKQQQQQHQQQHKSKTSKQQQQQQRLQFKNKNFTNLNLTESELNKTNSGKSIILNELPNYISLFDYDKATKDDMTIRKNDQLIVIDKT